MFMSLGVIKAKETVTETFSGKRKQSYSVKDQTKKLKKGKIDHREEALANCHEKKIEKVEDKKEVPLNMKVIATDKIKIQ